MRLDHFRKLRNYPHSCQCSTSKYYSRVAKRCFLKSGTDPGRCATISSLAAVVFCIVGLYRVALNTLRNCLHSPYCVTVQYRPDEWLGKLILYTQLAETLARTLKQQFRHFDNLRLSSFTDKDNHRLSKCLNCCFQCFGWCFRQSSKTV